MKRMFTCSGRSVEILGLRAPFALMSITLLHIRQDVDSYFFYDPSAKKKFNLSTYL